MKQIADDSPLLHFPERLSERQIVLLDGLRYSASMANDAYEQLWVTLQRIDQDLDAATWRDTSQAALFAWSIVDAAHRFRLLLEGLPGLKQVGWCKFASRQLSEAEAYRHGWQHQRGEAEGVVARRSHAFCSIGWVKHDGPKPTGRWFFVTAGHDLKGSEWTGGPSKAIPGVGTRRVRMLYGQEHPLYLGRLVRVINGAVGHLEESLRKNEIRLVGEQVNQKRSPDPMFEMGMQVLFRIEENRTE